MTVHHVIPYEYQQCKPAHLEMRLIMEIDWYPVTCRYESLCCYGDVSLMWEHDTMAVLILSL